MCNILHMQSLSLSLWALFTFSRGLRIFTHSGNSIKFHVIKVGYFSTPVVLQHLHWNVADKRSIPMPTLQLVVNRDIHQVGSWCFWKGSCIIVCWKCWLLESIPLGTFRSSGLKTCHYTSCACPESISVWRQWHLLYLQPGVFPVFNGYQSLVIIECFKYKLWTWCHEY